MHDPEQPSNQASSVAACLLEGVLPICPLLPCSMHTIEKGCLACNGRGECTNCKKGGLTILRDGRCVPCSAFIANCRLCSANGKTCKQ